MSKFFEKAEAKLEEALNNDMYGLKDFNVDDFERWVYELECGIQEREAKEYKLLDEDNSETLGKLENNEPMKKLKKLKLLIQQVKEKYSFAD